jgi:hypothetical protein
MQIFLAGIADVIAGIEDKALIALKYCFFLAGNQYQQ